ncbi:hypothetical protein PI124_g20887 [Phytophthora idaei]|nr:hypothetical protein PI124_g20887 [Phytophthora idaei]
MSLSSSLAWSGDEGSADITVESSAPFEIGALVKTIDKVESIYRNWVGPTIGQPDRGDWACYRKGHIMDKCPIGFNYKWKMCWTQCPLSYPVECGVECIRQNDDCAIEVYAKTANVVQTAISLATMGLFGQLTTVAKGVVDGAKCIRAMIGNIKMLNSYVRGLKVYDPQIPFDKVMALLYHTSYFTIDFPVAIAMCLSRSS